MNRYQLAANRIRQAEAILQRIKTEYAGLIRATWYATAMMRDMTAKLQWTYRHLPREVRWELGRNLRPTPRLDRRSARGWRR